MARSKDQAGRREQLVSATIALVADEGLTAVTLAGIADRAGVSHRLVAYYYPDLETLIGEAHAAAVERYYWTRLRSLERPGPAAERLRRLIRSGLPGRADAALSQVLNELAADAGRNAVHAALMGELFEREVSLYTGVLQEGASSGEFTLAAGALDVARTIVALEDAYGFHLLARRPTLSRATVLRLLTDYANLVTGRTR